MTAPLPVPEAENLISTEQLEQWKDELAAWWSVESIRYDHKRVISIFKKRFGVSEKHAIQMEFNSREDSEKFIEQYLNLLVKEFKNKIGENTQVSKLDVKMSFQYGAFAAIEFPAGSGQMHNHDVDGHVGIVGKVYYTNGTATTVFQKFISHPFWQYSHKSSNKKSNLVKMMMKNSSKWTN